MKNDISGAPVHRCGGYSVVGVTGPLSLAAFVVSTLFSPFHGFMQDSRRCAVVNDLMINLRLAQRSADELGHTVTVCAADAGVRRCADRADWSHGWIAFVDLDGDGHMSARETRTILQRTINSNASVTVAGTETSFSFRPFYAVGGSEARSAGTLSVCNAGAAKVARTVVISPSAPARAADADAHAPACA